jgi:hypothetical protein
LQETARAATTAAAAKNLNAFIYFKYLIVNNFSKARKYNDFFNTLSLLAAQ